MHPQVRNLDIVDGEGVDYVADISQNIPLPDDSVDVILTQEVLEHVANPLVAMREISRVLRPGGTLYLQVPFIIGYHPGPNDYWRFTREGIVQLAESSGLRLRETGRALGPATGYYRISVEFWATLLGIRSRRTYLLSKGGLSVLLYPIKFMDRFMNVALEADRIAGGYYVIADKP